MPAIILLCIGVGAIIAELFSGSFFLCFLGIGFIFTAILDSVVDLSLFGNRYAIQAISVCVVSLIALLALRKPMKQWFSHSSGYKECLNEEFSEAQEGEVVEGMVYFRGTLWHYDFPAPLSDGDKVRIKGIKDNKVLLENV